MSEDQDLEKKALAKVLGSTADWDGVAKECVCFANSRGGTLLLGIADGQRVPPPGQTVEPSLPERVVKRVSELTVNVSLPLPTVETAKNGGEFIRVVVPRSAAPACTTSGRYFIRVSDECKPLLPEDLLRLAEDKGALTWELRPTAERNPDPEKRSAFLSRIRASDRVSDFVRGKTDDDLLRHYHFVRAGRLTNLGVLWIGSREARAALAHAPVVQFLRFNAGGQRTVKETWTDYDLNPRELLEAIVGMKVWDEAVDVPAGAYREQVPIYDRTVVRELVANALVHRLYTARGDIFVNHHPDRLEVVSPGRLPVGVTPANILHQSIPRNPHLATVFHDLALMEREGTGYDTIYEVLLSSGKDLPVVKERDDRVTVHVAGTIQNLDALRVVESAERAFDLTPRETITLGLIALYERVSGLELVDRLGLGGSNDLRSWMGSLRTGYGLVLAEGTGRATRYHVNPEIANPIAPRLGRVPVDDLRLRVLQDVRDYPGSLIGEIRERLADASPHKVSHELQALIPEQVVTRGRTKGTRYFPAGGHFGQEEDDARDNPNG